MKKTRKNGHWPWGFKAGDRVTCKRKRARVVKAIEKDVPAGMVPIIFADRETNPEAFICVPADHLYLGWDEKTWKWGPFIAGDLVTYQGKYLAQVVMAFSNDVPPGRVPIIFSDPDRTLVDDRAITKATEFVPMDDLKPA